MKKTEELNMSSFENESVKRAIQDLNVGKFILVYDVDGREEEVDLVVLAEKVTNEHVYHLRHDAGGLICIAMDKKIGDGLGLPFMAEVYSKLRSEYQIFESVAPYGHKEERCSYGDKPSFSITINHRNTRTGITDHDRALTISEFAKLGRQVFHNGVDPVAYREQFGKNFRAPGHTHLLLAAPQLLKDRKGHTELTVTLARLGNLTPVIVLCEMLDGKTGRALSLKKAREYAREHGLVMVEGKEIISAFNEQFKELFIQNA